MAEQPFITRFSGAPENVQPVKVQRKVLAAHTSPTCASQQLVLATTLAKDAIIVVLFSSSDRLQRKLACIKSSSVWSQQEVGNDQLCLIGSWCVCVCHKMKVVNKTDDRSALIRGTRLVLAILKTFRPSSERASSVQRKAHFTVGILGSSRRCLQGLRGSLSNDWRFWRGKSDVKWFHFR